MGTYQPQKMTVFITSMGSGDGGNLGGLAGADRICAERATAVGAPRRTWRAYLSTTAEGTQKGVDARNRIGSGPWYNARGAEVGRNAADLHRPGSPINKETALDEHGAYVKGRGDTPNRHDILTGTTADGRVAEGLTCANWTSNGAAKARVGHFDRTGGGAAPNSWVSAHDSRSCSQPDLQATGGDGLFLCFASR
jgi:uncharacterized protein YidB (DUF937 family)